MKTAKAVQDGKESALAMLKQAWAEQEGTIGKAEVERDSGRGQVLAQGAAQGLTQRDMVQALNINKTHVDQLLRYHRFNQFVKTELPARCGQIPQTELPARCGQIPQDALLVTEGRFRKYWLQVRTGPRVGWGPGTSSDPDLAAQRDEYEGKIFDRIVTMILQGEAPAPWKRAAQAKPKAPPVEQTEAQRQFGAYLVEREGYYLGRVWPHVEKLMELSNVDHPMLSSPGWIAAHCRKIHQEMTAMFTLSTEEVPDDTKKRSARSK